MMKYTRFSAFSGLFAAALLSSPVHAVVTSITTPTSTVTQVTEYPSSDALPYDAGSPAISKDGSKIAFISDADLTGQGTNPDNLANLFVVNSDGSGLRQLTFATLDPTHQRGIPYFTKDPALSADGSVVVFASSNNLVNDESGKPLNAPEPVETPYYSPDTSAVLYYQPNYQIFIMNTDGTGLRQLTHGSGDSIFPRISNAGDVIAFQSSQDLIGANADRNEEIYVIKADGSRLSQVTAGVKGRRHDSRNVAISGDGTTVAFDSFIDLVPPLNDDLSNEIYVFDLAGFWRDGAGTAELSKYTVQITNTDIDAPYHVRAEDSFEPTLSYDGSWVAFAACINPDGEGIGNPNRTILGTNPYLPDVLYIARRDGTEMRQLTFSDDGDAYADDPYWKNEDDDIQRPQLSDDGRRIVFASRSRVDIVNPEKRFEIAMIDLDAPLGPEGRPAVEQLTYNTKTTGPYVLQLTFGNTDGYKLRPSISADASRIVFHASSDFTGGNPDRHDEVFMVEPGYIKTAATVPVVSEVDVVMTDDGAQADDDAPADVIGVAESEAGLSGNEVVSTIEESIVVEVDESASAIDDTNQNDTAAQVASNENKAKSGGLAAFGLAELLMVLLGLAMFMARRSKIALPRR